MDYDNIRRRCISYKNSVKISLKGIFLQEQKRRLKLVKKNEMYRNIHNGQRCFILGNGPSLLEENLKLLDGECVFTVNQISRSNKFKDIRPQYHFWADLLFFDANSQDDVNKELVDTMLNVNTADNAPECFFPVEAMEFIKKKKIDDTLKVNYFLNGLLMFQGYKKSINFAKCVPAFSSVVQWSIAMAIYMGFSEIYLLGCDHTGVITSIALAADTYNGDNYAYDISKNEKTRQESLTRVPLEAFIRAYLHSLENFRILYNYCCDKSIKLINCSKKSAIDSIPKMRLEDVLR